MSDHEEYITYDTDESNEALVKLSKKVVLRKEKHYRADRKTKSGMPAPDTVKLKSRSKSIAKETADIDAITEMLPEIERAMSILESAILSPKDLLDPSLMYRVGEHVESEAAGAFITIVADYLNLNFDLNEQLPDILRNALHRTGSYIYAVLPESTVDDIINSDDVMATEGFTDRLDRRLKPRPLGLLGMGTRITGSSSIAVEDANGSGDVNAADYAIGPHVHVYDNFDLLKTAALRKRVTQSSVMSKIGKNFALETADGKSAYTERDYTKQAFVELRSLSDIGKTSGGPLVMSLPSESVIPVHVSGDPKAHVGYFVLLDDSGNPITMDVTSSQYDLLGETGTDTDDVASLLQQTRESLGLSVGSKSKDNSFETYTALVERDLANRLSNGVYTDSLTIASNDTVYRIMMARALTQKKTDILFLPAELVSYIAFDYTADGIGKTRLAGSKILASMRAVLLFAGITAAIKNSVPSNKLMIEFDPEDDDPEGTVNDIVEEFIKYSASGTPAGSTLNAADITKFLQRASITVEASGNDKYPGTKVSVEDNSRSVTEPDDTLDENLSKRIFMKMGLSPEVVDSSFDAEFATTVVANNLLLSKLASGLQKTLLKHMTRFIKMIVTSDGNLMTAIEEAVSEVKGIKPDDVQETIRTLIDGLEARLPSAENSKFSAQMEAYTVYKDAIEDAVEAYINEDMLTDYLDTDLADGVAPAIAAIKAYYLRAWLQRENVLPELAALVDIGGEGMDVAKMHLELVEGAAKNFGELFATLRKVDRDFERTIDKDTEKDETKWDLIDNPPEPDPEPEVVQDDPAVDEVVDDTIPGDEPPVDEVTPPEDVPGVTEEPVVPDDPAPAAPDEGAPPAIDLDFPKL